MKKNLLKYIYTLLFLFYLPLISFAQEDDIDPHPADDDPPAVPIDSEFLCCILVIGIIVLVYVYMNNRKVFR